MSFAPVNEHLAWQNLAGYQPLACDGAESFGARWQRARQGRAERAVSGLRGFGLRGSEREAGRNYSGPLSFRQAFALVRAQRLAAAGLPGGGDWRGDIELLARQAHLEGTAGEAKQRYRQLAILWALALPLLFLCATLVSNPVKAQAAGNAPASSAVSGAAVNAVAGASNAAVSSVMNSSAASTAPASSAVNSAVSGAATLVTGPAQARLAGGVKAATDPNVDDATNPSSGTSPTDPENPTAPEIRFSLGNTKPSTALTVFLLITVMSVVPSLLLMTTSFTKIFITLAMVRTAIGLQQTPPNQVIAGLSLFLTLFIMQPVINEVYDQAIYPYFVAEEAPQDFDIKGFAQAAAPPMREFMGKHTRQEDIALITRAAGRANPQNLDDVPFTTLVPAFMISEVRSAFIIGFVIFIPFLVIDLVVSASLMSMGMMMLPPVMVSLPFKILLFVMVDGWGLMIETLVGTYR